MDGIIYLFGGSSDDGSTTYNLTMAYDPIRDQFTTKRKMPITSEAAACTTIGSKIYHTGGANQDPVIHPNGATYYNNLWVFDPYGGVAPNISSLTRTSPNSVHLAWQGELGRSYGIESTKDPVQGPWARVNLSTGATILATNASIEATCTIDPTSMSGFFRILEAN